MKKTPREPVYKIDEFEDLTLFANESFDTENVDLFEFSGEESSPLSRLKSIILSLDWEINDEILQELADEVEHLQASGQDDKVADIYLQGLGKIGGYIRSKGAYAHPNSIKLLLTFFYNFEKIVSTQGITSEDITQLLASDVRKFRILQYQINQSEGQDGVSFDERTASPTPALTTVAPVAEREQNQNKELRAAILSLDWEVTDESLKQFNARLSPFHQRFADNRPALVLILGLQALGDYISEQRAQTHPDAFLLLHSFSEALDQLAQTDQEPLAADQIEEILVDRVNRLNSLKMLIANPAAALDHQRLDEMVGEISAPGTGQRDRPVEIPPPPPLAQPSLAVEPLALETAAMTPAADSPADTFLADIDTLFAMEAKPAMETADRQYPDEILPPEAITPVDDELADDFIEAQLSHRGLMPALSDTDEVSGYSEEAQPLDLPTQSDLAEQLDFLFSDASTAEGTTQQPAASRSVATGEEGAGTLADFFPGEERVEAALAGAEPPSEPLDLDPEDPASRQSSLEIQDTLDSFFALAMAEGKDEQPDEAETGAADQTDGPIPALTEALAEAPADNLEEVESALAGAEEPERMDQPGGDETGDRVLDIQGKLDLFFGDSAEAPVAGATAAELSVEEIEQSLFFTEDKGIESALADSSENRGFSEEEAVATLDYLPMEEIEEKLDFFFGAETDLEPLPITAQDSGSGDGPVEPPQPPAPDLTLTGEEKSAGEERAATETASPLDQALEGALNALFAADEEPQAPAPAEPTELAELLASAVTEGDEEADSGGLAVLEDSPASSQILLATLGVLLPGVIRSTSAENVAKAEQLLADLANTSLSADHQALLQLLQSVINLMSRLPGREGAVTEQLVNHLYEHMLVSPCPPGALAEAVGGFTAWLHGGLAVMPTLPTRTDETSGAQFAYTAKELYFELTELRLQINKEFAQLRHDMHHRH